MNSTILAINFLKLILIIKNKAKYLLRQFVICLVSCSLHAQYKNYVDLDNDSFKQQKVILKKEKIKKLTIRTYSSPFNNGDLEPSSDTFINFDNNFNIASIIYQDCDTKISEFYSYNKSNLLKEKNRKTEKGVFKTTINNSQYSYIVPIARLFPTKPNKILYNYDSSNKLIKKKTCIRASCKIERYKYFGNKNYTYFIDEEGKIEQTKICQKKDSIEIELKHNKLNEVEYKSIKYFNKDFLKIREEHFNRDTLIYKQLIKIEDNKIIQSITSEYYRKKDSNEMTAYVNGEYFIYDESYKLKTKFKIDRNENTTKKKYEYYENGLLKSEISFFNDKLSHSRLYQYE
ncbi:hypothetical protein [uncultured Algibacter sp.]|uniref:hypothetical protein n=1 Tax=uncultured Algibacter sp. TaxID=298659 RepID=UPI0026301E6E|nr:hypothetical protein [uncultured Algibacter sp.]